MVLFIGDITIAFSRDEGFILQNHNIVNHIIDFDVDKEGNYYYLDYDEGNTYMYKVSRTGELFFKNKLPFRDDDRQMYYKKILVDGDGSIYTSATVTPRNSRIIKKEIMQKYDSRGNYKKTKLEVLQDEPMDLGDPFAAFSGRLINVQIIRDKLYAFERKSDQEITLLEVDIEQANSLEAVEIITLEFDNTLMRDIIYTDWGDIYFLDRQAEIYLVDKSVSLEKIDTTYNSFDMVIPYTLSGDSQGNLYYVDVYNKNIVKHSYQEGRSSKLYDFSHLVDEEKNIMLEDLRNIRVLNDNQLAGHSMILDEGEGFMASIIDGSGSAVSRANITFSQAINEYSLWIVIIIAGMVVLALLIHMLSRMLSGRIGLQVKQILIFLPIYIIIMIIVALSFSSMIGGYTLDIAYQKVSSLAEVTADLLDVEKFVSINHPGDDFGKEFVDIQQDLTIDRSAIYYVSYFVEDSRIFVGVANNIQSYTPVEYLYDQETLHYYYEVLRTGEKQMGETIDEFGEWMFALAPLRDSRGEIIGIIEQGWHAEIIRSQIEVIERNILIVLISIALIVAVVYMFMLKYSLRSLDVLKKGVAEVASGHWDTRVNIKTRDEFKDIGLAFNKMSSQIQEYINEVTQLNKAYIKFVPEKFIYLLGKKTVLDVQSGDHVVGQMTVMYANIRNIDKHSKEMGIKESYNFANNILEIIARKVSENQGVVQKFEGAGAISLFKENPERALISSLYLIEEIEQFNLSREQNVDLGVTISSGQLLLGIVGHENRLATTVISQEMHSTYALERISEKLGIKLLITRATLDSLAHLKKYNYRYAGKVMDGDSQKVTEIYEFLDSYDPDSKKVKINTKKLLEEGIAYYQDGNLPEARKKFIEVIRIDQKDTLAKNYLFLCEKYGREELTQWQGILEYF